MPKKKSSRQKHKKEALVGDTSEEELKEAQFEGKVCPHIAKGLNFSRVKRCLRGANVALCGVCPVSRIADRTCLPKVELCLQCGNRSCSSCPIVDRIAQPSSHSRAVYSDCHALSLNTWSGVVVCQECNEYVSLEQSRYLKQCVEFLMKLKAPVLLESLVTYQHDTLKSVMKEQGTVDSKGDEVKIVNKNKKETLPSRSCVKGLRNLGNTCFLNAVLQNLNQTRLLYRVLEKVCALDYMWEIPRLTLVDDEVIEEASDELLKIAIPRQFPLATSLLQVYKLLNASNEIVNPSPLFTEISKKCPQFKHFQQQDSHELLRQLLDGLRQDEVKRQKKAILRYFDVCNISTEEVDDETKKLIKAYSCYASHTLVEKIFGGLFLSTVLCEECKSSSQVFEPFMDMSLPLFEEKHQDNCNQPYLDGGQQKDFEPLRNRKGGIEQDDENNEFVLNKPKIENGKPSKHQLRKLKELAKKDKKKKNKTRKISDTNEDLPDGEEIIKENDSDVENTHIVTVEEKETDCNLQYDEENTVNPDEEIKNRDNSQCITEKVEIEDSQFLCKVSNIINVQNGPNVNEQSLHDTNDLFSNALKTSENSNGQTFSDNQKNVDLHKKDTEKVESDYNSVNDFSFGKCGVKEKLGWDEPIVPNDSPENCTFHDILEDLLVDEVPTQNIPIDLEQAVKFESISEDLQTDDILIEKGKELSENHKDTDPIANSHTVPGTSCFELLTENLKKINLSNALDSDEKMQTLGLQVRDVQICRDSDHQGSILNSSLSPDEETALASCESQDDTCDNDNEKISCNFSESQIKEWMLKPLFTLKPRVKCDPNECSIDSSLTYFTKPELLIGSNKFRCEKCTELKISKSGNKKDVAYCNASKQFLIFSPPAILTLHLKRFQQVGMSLRKVNRFVEFPVILDLAPYCSSACLILPHMSSVKDEVLYSLYGVVEHSGRMSSGHYTAYIKVAKRTLNENFMCHLPLAQCDLEQLLQKFSKIGSDKSRNSDKPGPSQDCRWYYVSDAQVREVSEERVMKCQAYLLFYERIK